MPEMLGGRQGGSLGARDWRTRHIAMKFTTQDAAVFGSRHCCMSSEIVIGAELVDTVS